MNLQRKGLFMKNWQRNLCYTCLPQRFVAIGNTLGVKINYGQEILQDLHSIARKSSSSEIQIPSFFHVQEESSFCEQLFLFRPAAVKHKPEQGVSPGNPGSPGDLRSRTVVSALSKRQPGTELFPAGFGLLLLSPQRASRSASVPVLPGPWGARWKERVAAARRGRRTQGPPLTAGVVLRALARVPAHCEHPDRPPQPLHGRWGEGGTKPELSACCQLGISLCRGNLSAWWSCFKPLVHQSSRAMLAGVQLSPWL